MKSSGAMRSNFLIKFLSPSLFLRKSHSRITGRMRSVKWVRRARVIAFHVEINLLLELEECLLVMTRRISRNQGAYELKVDSELDMRYKIGKMFVLIVGILFAIVMGRKIYRFVSFGTPIKLSRPQEASLTDFNTVPSFPIVLNENDQAIDYDFNNLVILLEECELIKRDFYADFTPHFARIKEVDRQKVEDLLKQLYQERTSFKHYASELKGCAKHGLSIKKRRSLDYYLNVIQRNILDLERIKKIFSS